MEKQREEYLNVVEPTTNRILYKLYPNKWKCNYKYTKVFQNEVRLLKLSGNGIILFYTLLIYLGKDTSRVMFGKESMSNQRLTKLSGLGDRTLTNTIKELKDKKVIAVIGGKRDRQIIINPHYAINGKLSNMNILELF